MARKEIALVNYTTTHESKRHTPAAPRPPSGEPPTPAVGRAGGAGFFPRPTVHHAGDNRRAAPRLHPSHRVNAPETYTRAPPAPRLSSFLAFLVLSRSGYLYTCITISRPGACFALSFRINFMRGRRLTGADFDKIICCSS